MTYEVLISPRAMRDIDEAVAYIELDSPANAQRWLQGIREAIASLADLPRRCPPARESSPDGPEFRQLVFGSYRILFTITGQTVEVVHVRHGQRADAGPEEIDV